MGGISDGRINDRDIKPTWRLVYGFAAAMAVIAFVTGYQAGKGDAYDPYMNGVPTIWEDGSVTWYVDGHKMSGCLEGQLCDDSDGVNR